MQARDDGAEGLPDSLFRHILDRTAMPFVIIDTSGTIVHASSSLAVVTGWRAAALIGRNMVEFVEPGAAEMAVAALSEITSFEEMDSSVPIVFPVLHPDGGTRHLEVSAMPLHHQDVGNLVALRLRSWEGERHMSDFVVAMAAGEALAQDLEILTRSITASLEGVGASVHHGFDGEAFHGVAGSWPGAAALPRSAPPWIDVLGGEDVVQVPAAPGVADDIGATIGWLVPVQPRDGSPPAVLSVWRRQANPPFLGHQQGLQRAAHLVELAVVRAAEHERLVHLARHDPLTGLANRATFRALVAEALARGERDLAVGFCDLDGFKQVNDDHGHGVGDDVLVEVADRLRSSLREGDELGRAGGDEFTILWRGVPDVATAEAVANRLVATTETALALQGGRALRIGVSVGVALAEPGTSVEALLAAADAALYRSKKAGGGRATAR